jgi:hypothetical protein
MGDSPYPRNIAEYFLKFVYTVFILGTGLYLSWRIK